MCLVSKLALALALVPPLRAAPPAPAPAPAPAQQHVPFRNSLLTSVLRESLEGRCVTVLLATLNPEAQ